MSFNTPPPKEGTTAERFGAEPFPAIGSVQVRALRGNSEADAERLRNSVPRLVAGIIAEVPGGETEVGMACGRDGLVSLDVEVSGEGPMETVLEEVAAALQPIAETTTRPMTTTCAGQRMRWPLVSDVSRGALGFRAEPLSGPQSVNCASVGRDSSADRVADELIEVLARTPGQGVRMRLRPGGAGGRGWQAQLTVVSVDGPPPLRLKATLRRLFPGLRVADSQTCEPARLQLADADLAQVWLIPVAGAAAPVGVCMGDPAPIAVTPTSRQQTEQPGSGVHLGYASTEAGHQQPVELGVDERLRHLHVLGRTGTGKSSMLAGLVHGIAATGDGALVADPHGTLCDRILAELPAAAADRVWLIRCGDVANPVPLNPLAEDDPVRREIAIDEIGDCFQYLFDRNATGIVGPRFRERVGMALRAMSTAFGWRTSLLDVPIALADDEFMDAAAHAHPDARVRAWWTNDKVARRSNDYGEVVAWVNSKFEKFTATAAMRAILGSGLSAVDFATAMDDGRIILLDLSKSHLGEPASRLLGYLYLGSVWSAALRRVRPERPFHVVVDEAHTLISGAMTNMLAEGRKFGLSVTLAHQYLSQLDADLRPAVDGNVATTVAFRCAVGDAVEITRRFGGLVDPAVLMTLPDLTAITLRTAASANARPHTLTIDHNRTVTARIDTGLAAVTARVRHRTHAELVNPFRAETRAAAQGNSRILTRSAALKKKKQQARDTFADFLTEWQQHNDESLDS